MIAQTWISIGVCLVALALTLQIVRNSDATLGLPLAYMLNLLLIHIPGAYAFVISGGLYAGIQRNGEAIALGISLTATGSVAFLLGAAIAMSRADGGVRAGFVPSRVLNTQFAFFCLVMGGLLTFGVAPLRRVPTLGAALYFGSSVWMLVALVGLSTAVERRKVSSFLAWLALVLTYPMVILVLTGFLSYGAAAVIIVGSLAVARLRSSITGLLMIFALGYLGISVFVNYFGSRTDLRSTLWSGDGFEQRIDAVASAFSDFTLFTPDNPDHLVALDARLNQNEFAGITAQRLQLGQVQYLNGQSFWEAAISPIPRAIWTNKPVSGGSGDIVRNMTGIRLSRGTSWGVGNVMELYMNFGLYSLIPGFMLLGFSIGWLDRRAAIGLGFDDPSRSLLYFLPCVALIQPNNSMVEVIGGAFAALLAAVGLRMAWKMFGQGQQSRSPENGNPNRGTM